MEIFAPTPRGCRKVVLSTNLAEASVTVDGIAFVIDCGLVKVFSRLFYFTNCFENCRNISFFHPLATD